MMISKPFDWRSAGNTALCAAGTALLLAGCSADIPQQAQASPPPVAPKPAEPAFSPVVSINALMVTMVDNAGHVLWDVEKKGFAPKNDVDWLEIEDHATQLAAAGSLIQMGGTGPADAGWVQQVGWKTNAQAMSTAALGALSAAKSKNLDALVKANSQLVESCEGCHKEFKRELPTEGIVHQRPHSESTTSRR